MIPPAATPPPAPTATAATPPARNPGPPFGYRLLRLCDRLLPEALFKPLRAAGTAFALAAMPAQRRHSRAYLRLVLPREPTLRDLFRHFLAFEETLMLKLRVVNGRIQRTAIAPGSEHFKTYLNSGHHAFLGTFHVGHSDLLGFLLGPVENHRVFMIRHRVGNSHDTEKLGALFGRWIQFIWVNDPQNLLFALKDAIASGGSVALQCDRLDFASKTEPFHFLGSPRLFPFTIYHLALIFDLPVLLSVGIPSSDPAISVLHSAPHWAPDRSLPRSTNLARARDHFQHFLLQLESLLRADPYLWFNFTPLNPPAAPSPSSPPPALPLRSRQPASP